MRINPVHERIELRDRLHIFTTSKRSALACLEVLNSEVFLECVVNSQSWFFFWNVTNSFGSIHFNLDSQYYQFLEHYS